MPSVPINSVPIGVSAVGKGLLSVLCPRSVLCLANNHPCMCFPFLNLSDSVRSPVLFNSSGLGSTVCTLTTIRVLPVLLMPYSGRLSLFGRLQVTWKGNLKRAFPDPNAYSAFMVRLYMRLLSCCLCTINVDSVTAVVLLLWCYYT